MKIVTVLGTRPEIIKMAPLLPEFDKIGNHIIIHSGQHYSAEMDVVFFEDLELRQPDVFLKVGSLRPVLQVAKIASGVEEVIIREKPDLVVVHGDTNTTLGGALAAAKYRNAGVRLAHIEAGARSFNDLQPEELNRQLVDRMSDLLFVPTEEDAANLEREGIDKQKVFVTGNTVVESCLRMAKIIEEDNTEEISTQEFALVTIHRAENVDDQEKLLEIWQALCELSESIPIIFPIHPRTRKMLKKAGIEHSPEQISLITPVGYKEMLVLLKSARFCMTDSGGLQEEAAILGVPALVVRRSTEHKRYVACGLHVLTDYHKDRIISEANILLNDENLGNRRQIKPELDAKVVSKILTDIKKL